MAFRFFPEARGTEQDLHRRCFRMLPCYLGFLPCVCDYVALLGARRPWTPALFEVIPRARVKQSARATLTRRSAGAQFLICSIAAGTLGGPPPMQEHASSCQQPPQRAGETARELASQSATKPAKERSAGIARRCQPAISQTHHHIATWPTNRLLIQPLFQPSPHTTVQFPLRPANQQPASQIHGRPNTRPMDAQPRPSLPSTSISLPASHRNR